MQNISSLKQHDDIEENFAVEHDNVLEQCIKGHLGENTVASDNVLEQCKRLLGENTVARDNVPKQCKRLL